MVKKRDVYQYFLFRTLIETGMRIGEASALCWKDYDRKLKQFQSQNLIIKKK